MGAAYETAYAMEYSMVDDDALAGLVESDGEPVPMISSQSSIGRDPVSSSFPSSPAPSLPSSPSSFTPTPLAQYTDTEYTPVPRDYAMDYEACLTAVRDLNRFGTIIRRGDTRGLNPHTRDDVVVYRDDVVAVLSELRDMLNRMFDRMRA